MQVREMLAMAEEELRLARLGFESMRTLLLHRDKEDMSVPTAVWPQSLTNEVGGTLVLLQPIPVPFCSHAKRNSETSAHRDGWTASGWAPIASDLMARSLSVAYATQA